MNERPSCSLRSGSWQSGSTQHTLTGLATCHREAEVELPTWADSTHRGTRGSHITRAVRARGCSRIPYDPVIGTKKRAAFHSGRGWLGLCHKVRMACCPVTQQAEPWVRRKVETAALQKLSACSPGTHSSGQRDPVSNTGKI